VSTDKNKEIVLNACAYISERNFPALFDLIDDEGSWTLPNRPDRFQYGGRNDKAGTKALLEGFLKPFTDFRFDVLTITAEDDRVVVEATTHGTGPGKATYNNNYLIMFKLRNGKLVEVTESLDPFQVLAYVEQLPAS
jgi:ketosteroid isomerase-like protein